MNRLEQALHYMQKVFGLKTRLRAVRDQRPFAQIDTLAALLCLLLGVFTRVSSYLDLAQQTQRRRWQHLCGLQGPVGDDLFGYVTERLDAEDLRQALAGCVKTLKQNKALESCKINGLLFLSLDANEHFASRSRCCAGCCQRQVEETGSDGQKHKVTEYYHRYVFAQINGPTINVLLDVEPIRPGEEECAAALRLLGRLRRIYGPRFFDALTADAWYAKGPFLRAVDKLGWSWVVVLKREDMEVYQGGHRRWGIENKAFNELTQGYHLEHCYHHQPDSMLAQMLILSWGFLLFSAFAQLHAKLIVLGKITAKALAQQLNLALEEDLPWEQWFHSG